MNPEIKDYSCGYSCGERATHEVYEALSGAILQKPVKDGVFFTWRFCDEHYEEWRALKTRNAS